MATLAAPPGALVERTERSTGTGASGEMRSTSPQMERSSITSPITRMCNAANPLSTRERMRDCSFTTIPSSSQIKSRFRDWPILRGARGNSIFPSATAYGEQVTKIQRCPSPDNADTAPRHQMGPGDRLAGDHVPAALDRRLIGVEGRRGGRVYHHGVRLPRSGAILPLGLSPPDVAAAQSIDRHLPFHRRHADPAAVAH